MIKIDIMTLFCGICDSYISESIIGRAQKAGLIQINTHNIRDYANNKHNSVDDTPYGGGEGMVIQAMPVFDCYKHITKGLDYKPYTVYMSPKGKVLTQKRCIKLSKEEHIVILCGHYEGVDQRIIDEIIDEEISIGDYVLTGGELGALVLTDSVCRLCDGVLSSEECYINESHFNGLLEHPHYTRPAVWNGKAVPEVLLNGNHALIEQFRREKSLEETFFKRQDMLEKAELSKKDKDYIDKLK